MGRRITRCSNVPNSKIQMHYWYIVEKGPYITFDTHNGVGNTNIYHIMGLNVGHGTYP